MKRIKIALIGASGYTGMELLRLLLKHPNAQISIITSRQYEGKKVSEVFPRFHALPEANLTFSKPEIASIVDSGAEIAFLAVPHGVALDYAHDLLKHRIKVIDLSADFRLNDPNVYEEFYENKHPYPELLKKAVYGLPELYQNEIKNARLVASPGCYPTSIELPLIALLKANIINKTNISASSMSGVTGAGKKAAIPLLFAECNESARAYGVPKHRHLSEIEQELSIAAKNQVTISFTPHLIPVNRGICTTIHADISENVNLEKLSEHVNSAFAKAYQNAPFVRLLGEDSFADIKNVVYSNYIDIGWAYDPRLGKIILSSAIDNLGKGAASQAIQSFNIMQSLQEDAGLNNI